MWSAYQQTQQSQTQSEPTLVFNAHSFVDSIGNRINKSVQRKYSQEDIQRFLENPIKFEAAIREASNYLYSTCQEYKNLTRYFSKMLTFDNILIPDNVSPDIYDDSDKIMKSFYKNLQFVNDYNIKYKLKLVTDILVKEDYFFAYEKSDGENYIWHRLPSNYCRVVGMDMTECYLFEFDFSYFNKENVSINNYDEDFKTKYNKYKSNGSKYRWQQLDQNKQICFKFDESVLFGLPLFSSMFDELFRLEDIKELQSNNLETDNYKLIHQKIPMDTKDSKPNKFLIDEVAAKAFHQNVRSNVPKGIGVTTTPMDLDSITLKSTNSAEENIVAKQSSNLFTTAGVSQLLFNSEKSGAIGLNRSLDNDMSLMFSLLRQFEVWFKKRLKILNGKKYRWKLNFLDTTIYNRNQVIEQYLKIAQYGLPKVFITASLGISHGEMMGVNIIENKHLKMTEMMMPLSSSHTSSGKDSEESGAPSKSEELLSDKGIETRDNQGNDNRSQ